MEYVEMNNQHIMIHPHMRLPNEDDEVILIAHIFSGITTLETKAKSIKRSM